MKITGLNSFLIFSAFNWFAFTFLGAFFLSHPANYSRMFFTVALINMGISVILFIVWVKSKKLKSNDRIA